MAAHRNSKTLVLCALDEKATKAFLAKMPEGAVFAQEQIEPQMLNNSQEWTSIASDLAAQCCQKLAAETGVDAS